ncbi:MAG: tetratricopeptide repeat protein [Pirellulaceae bacterium]|nr:tetratricopeptide repeat protein [Pirellulaceae bacterium]
MALALSEGEGFRLILATYAAPDVRDTLIERLRVELDKHGVRLTCLDTGHRREALDLVEALNRHLTADTVPPNSPARRAVSVVNLESCLDYGHKTSAEANVLQRANLHRELFAERIRCPVVFWLMPVATGLFAREAPDLWHWRIATFDFTNVPDASAESIEPSRLTRAESFEEFRGFATDRQHEGIAALRDRLLQLEHLADGRALSPREQAQRAALLIELGKAHAAMGHREDAFKTTNDAVDIYRRLAAQRPDDFQLDLAMSLINLGMMRRSLGHREEALLATEEAVDVCRRLAEQHHHGFLPDFAASLNNLGAILSDLGRREDAARATTEAVEILRPLAAQHPDAFLPDLARSLHNLGAMLANLGRCEKALLMATEAAAILRPLASKNPESFLPDLANSLDNLGIWLGNLDRREEALSAAAEAVEIHRRLAAQHPDVFLPNLAMSLNNLGKRLIKLGHREQALRAIAEAVQVALPLVARYPQALLSDFRTYLQNLRKLHSDWGRDPDADPLVREAAELLARFDAGAAG